MNSVFVLHHSYEQEGFDETKFIGVYSSEIEAENAIKRLSQKNGFKCKMDGFVIQEYEIDHWSEGFVNMTTIQVKSIYDSWVVVSAECLPNNEYLIVEKYENQHLGEFKDGDIVRCREESGELFAIEKINKRD